MWTSDDGSDQEYVVGRGFEHCAVEVRASCLEHPTFGAFIQPQIEKPEERFLVGVGEAYAILNPFELSFARVL